MGLGGGRMLGAEHVTLTSAVLSDTIFRKDHRNREILDVVVFLVETGEEAEFCILGGCR